MHCEQARQLFDAYLDGELSPALATELGAHRLRCPECRRALALLEVSGHIIASDRDPVALHREFTDRLVACTEKTAVGRFLQVRRALYIAGPLAAAAVIALAFLGVFDGRGATKVAGVRVEPEDVEVAPASPAGLIEAPPLETEAAGQRALEEWFEQIQARIRVKRRSGESLQKALDLTILQFLDTLEKAGEAPRHEDHFPGADVSGPTFPSERVRTESDGVEDL